MAEVLVSGIAEPVSLPMAVIIKSCPVLPGTTESGRKEKAMGGQWGQAQQLQFSALLKKGKYKLTEQAPRIVFLNLWVTTPTVVTYQIHYHSNSSKTTVGKYQQANFMVGWGSPQLEEM